MVIGRYVANHQKGLDYLELKTDGTYILNFKSSDGKEFINTNQWEFEYRDGNPWITFSGFVFGLPGYGTQKPGFWLVEVEKSFLTGNLRLCIDPDLNYYYEKQNKK
jgi:hypothetical protein